MCVKKLKRKREDKKKLFLKGQTMSAFALIRGIEIALCISGLILVSI